MSSSPSVPPTPPNAAPRVTRAGYSTAEIRRSLWFVLVAWGFGAPFFALTTSGVFTSFLKDYLGTSDQLYGLIVAIGPAAAVLQIAGSYMVERTGRTKPQFLVLVTAHRLVWLVIAAVPLFYAPKPASMVPAALVAITVLLSQAMMNIGGAGWTAWMAQIVPASIAGRYFGVRNALGITMMVVSQLIITGLLAYYRGQGWMYAVAFGAAALMGAVDILLFIPVADRRCGTSAALPSLGEIILIPWRSALFRGYALHTVVVWTSYIMVGSFLWRYAMDPIAQRGLGMNVLTATIALSILPLIGMVPVAPFWGSAIDRFGPKPVLALSSAFHILTSCVWCVVQPGAWWVIIVLQIAGGAMWPGIDQVNLYMLLRGFPEERRTAYTAMHTVIFGLAGSLGGILGGFLAWASQTWLTPLPFFPSWMSHYQPVFFIGMLMRLFAFLFILRPLPMQGDAGHRDVAASIAGGMVDAVKRPVARVKRSV